MDTNVESGLFNWFYPQGYHPYKIKWFDRLIAFSLFLIAFIGYVMTLTPSVGAGDNGELTTTLYNMGAGHPPGYPLFGIIGKLFTFLPIGDIAYRVNLFVAFFGAGAVFFLYLILVKLLGLNRDSRQPSLEIHIPSIAASFLFAFSFSHWGQAIGGEVYPLNVFLVSFMLYIMLLWYEEIILFRREDNPHFGERMTLFLGFVMGLSLTNHMLPLWNIVGYIFVMLPLTILILVSERSKKFEEELYSRASALITFLILLLVSVILLYAFAIRVRMIFPEHLPLILIGIFLTPAYVTFYTILTRLKILKGKSAATFIFILLCIAGVGIFIWFCNFVYKTTFISKTNQYLFAIEKNVGGMISQTPIEPIFIILPALVVAVIFLFGLYDSVIKKTNIEYGWVDKLIELFTYSGWLFIFAMSIYLYLMVRAVALAPLPDPKPLSWGDTQTLDILLNHMLRKQYGLGGGKEFMNFWGQVKTVIDFNLEQFHWINFVVALIGFAYFLIKEKIWAIYTLLSSILLSVALILFINFELDPRTISFQEVFFIQEFFIVAIYIGFGFQLILDLSKNGKVWIKNLSQKSQIEVRR